MLLERRQKRKLQHTGEGSWAVSYVDMLTLLLCFFIIFYSNSQTADQVTPLQRIVFDLNSKQGGKGEGKLTGGAVEAEKIGLAAGTGSGAATGTGEQVGVNLWGKNIAAREKGNISISPEDLALLEVVKARIETQSFARMKMTEKSLEVNFEGLSFFNSGEMKLRPEATVQLTKVIELLSKYKDLVKVTVQGHTDPTILNSRSKFSFSDNWELSVLRATSVLKVFIKNGFPQEQLSAEGFSDTQVRQPAEAITKEQLAKMRRITLRLEPIPTVKR